MRSLKKPSMIFLCPCGTGLQYESCCEIYHSGSRFASSAEILMRSRYSAYVLVLENYIQQTWHISTRVSSQIENEDKALTKWLGLIVEQAYSSEENPAFEAFVQFTARYKIGGSGAIRMRELSRFVREGEQWFYIDGVFLD